MKGAVPAKVLHEECAAVLSLEEFNEAVFLEKIDNLGTGAPYHDFLFERWPDSHPALGIDGKERLLD